jgi:hypothetical protein
MARESEIYNSVIDEDQPLVVTGASTIPPPLEPVKNPETDCSNEIGSRQGRLFKNYNDRNSSEQDDDDYTTIGDVEVVTHEIKRKNPPPVAPKTSRYSELTLDADENYFTAGNDHYYEQKYQSGISDDPLYSSLPESEFTLETADEDNEDYSIVIDHSDPKKQQINNQQNSTLKQQKINDQQNSAPKEEQINDVHVISATKPEYAKIRKTARDLRRNPSKQETESIYDNAPPALPNRPQPAPRKSLTLRPSSQTDHELYGMTKASSVGMIDTNSPKFKKNNNSISYIGGSFKTGQNIEQLLTTDLSSADKDELLAHIESLRDVVLEIAEKQTELIKKHQKNVQELCKKLEDERTARQNAVDRVMQLQDQIGQYQMHYGPL